MTHASSWLRRMEIALWIMGLSLAGVALGASFQRWQYQKSQEQALFGTSVDSARAAISAKQETSNVESAFMDRKTASGRHLEEPISSTVRERALQKAGATARLITRKKQTPADPLAIGRVEIRRLGVAAIVREGADEATLERAVGLVPGTAHPGEGGNVVLAAHRDTFFRPLQRIQLDDTIRLVVPGKTYEYRVDSMEVVEPTDTHVLESSTSERLTLVTCYPFRFIGPAPQRFVVTASRID
jgi:LPXTG-site transpeptidase (sortase) family protein